LVAIVHLSPDALSDPTSIATLASLAAEEELVLVCVECMVVEGLLRRIRDALPRRQIVALLVYSDIQPHERGLIEELLEEGKVPLVLTFDDPTADRLTRWLWLEPDHSVALPAQAA
jgi:hypothetical protein